MTAEEKTTMLDAVFAFWGWFKATRFGRAVLAVWRVILWSRWIITVVGFGATILWYAYVEGQDISGTLSIDYLKVQQEQSTLIKDALSLSEDLQNPFKKINLSESLTSLKGKAKATIGALGGLRSPTEAIEIAKADFRDALENMIAVANRIERGEIEGMELPLHNGLQRVSNTAGAFNKAVTDFQGGMWPQLVGSIF